MPMVNPAWLRYFLVLAETRNFHAAAGQLALTPQALSKAIAGLEAHYGVPLVERDRRVKGLTPAGEALRAEALAILDGLESAERLMADWRSPEPQGPVRLAGLDVWINHLLPTLLPGLLGRHPKLRPRLFNMLPDEIEKWVAAGEVDLGLLLAPPRREDLAWATGFATRYVIAGRPQPQRRWDELTYAVPKFFRRETASPLDGWAEADFPREATIEVEMLDTALELCEEGAAAAFVPEFAIRKRLAQGTLAVIAAAPCAFEDKLHVAWRRGVRHTPAVRAMLEMLTATAPSPP